MLSAIEYEKILAKPLAQVTAVELLQALHQASLEKGTSVLALADKKKYELWIEESQVTQVSIGKLMDRIRHEKKKVELEPMPDFRELVDPMSSQSYARLVEDVASRVSEKLRTK